MISVDNPQGRQDVDRIIAAYERGVGVGQDFQQTNIPYERGSAEEYAFLCGMGYGMDNHGDGIVFEEPLPDMGLLVKARNSDG